jgi:hypothetical protein
MTYFATYQDRSFSSHASSRRMPKMPRMVPVSTPGKVGGNLGGHYDSIHTPPRSRGRVSHFINGPVFVFHTNHALGSQ